MEKWEERIVAEEMPEGAIMLYGQFQGEDGYYECDFKQGVEYAKIDGHSLHLDLIQPVMISSKLPLIVFIQGSAWRPQPLHFAYSKMFHMASRGYVVAIVEYRNTDIARFPAPIEDVKTAIRFLRVNADKYGIDKKRVAVWGDSSGGHVALMTGFTVGKYHTDLYKDESDEVGAIVDFYGITDIAQLGYCNTALNHDSPEAPEALLIGGAVPENIEAANQASPMYNIPEGEMPATLIVHGDSDGVVNVSQSIRLYKKMRSMGKVVQFCKVIHADHGMGIWQKKVFDLADQFLRNYLFHPQIDGPLFQHQD